MPGAIEELYNAVENMEKKESYLIKKIMESDAENVRLKAQLDAAEKVIEQSREMGIDFGHSDICAHDPEGGPISIPCDCGADELDELIIKHEKLKAGGGNCDEDLPVQNHFCIKPDCSMKKHGVKAGAGSASKVDKYTEEEMTRFKNTNVSPLVINKIKPISELHKPKPAAPKALYRGICPGCGEVLTRFDTCNPCAVGIGLIPKNKTQLDGMQKEKPATPQACKHRTCPECRPDLFVIDPDGAKRRIV